MVSAMQIIGQDDTAGHFIPLDDPIPVRQDGNLLLDADNFPWAQQDDSGEWVSISLARIGIKSKLKVQP